jgi:hypothetical protein
MHRIGSGVNGQREQRQCRRRGTQLTGTGPVQDSPAAAGARSSGTVQPPIPEAGNWMAVPSRVTGTTDPLMPPVECPGGGPGERTEGGPGHSTGDGSGYCTGGGSGERSEDGPGDSTPDGPGDGTPDGPGYGTGDGPGYRTPGDPGGVWSVSPIFLWGRWLSSLFCLTRSCHIVTL